MQISDKFSIKGCRRFSIRCVFHEISTCEVIVRIFLLQNRAHLNYFELKQNWIKRRHPFWRSCCIAALTKNWEQSNKTPMSCSLEKLCFCTKLRSEKISFKVSSRLSNKSPPKIILFTISQLKYSTSLNVLNYQWSDSLAVNVRQSYSARYFRGKWRNALLKTLKKWF